MRIIKDHVISSTFRSSSGRTSSAGKMLSRWRVIDSLGELMRMVVVQRLKGEIVDGTDKLFHRDYHWIERSHMKIV